MPMSIPEALKIIDPPDNSIEALKKAYREKALQYHPDRQDGNEDFMKLVNAAYALLSDNIDKYDVNEDKTEGTSLTEKLQEIYEKIKHFQDIKIEVCGTWFWITGDTYTYRAELKELKFKWAKKKQAWYYHEAGYRKLTKRNWKLGEIRLKFGSIDLETITPGILSN